MSVICLTDRLYPNFRQGQVYPICNGFVQMEKDYYIFSLPLKMRKINVETNNFILIRSGNITNKQRFIQLLAENGTEY